MSFEQMTFGLPYRIKLDCLIKGLNSEASFLRPKVRFTEQPIILRRLRFEFDRVFKDLGSRRKLFLGNSEFSNIYPRRRIFDVRLKRMTVGFIRIIELVDLEIKRAKFFPGDIVRR